MKAYCVNCDAQTVCENKGIYPGKTELFQHKSLLRCLGCGLIFIYPTICQRDLNVYYNSVWLNDEDIVSTSGDVNIIYHIRAQERFKYLNSYVPFKEDMRILDVGAGQGDLLKEFRARLATPVLFATEENKINRQKLKKMGVRVAEDVEEFRGEKFDLINICFVLEHIINPKAFLENMLNYLNAGGYVFIDLPERDDTFKSLLEPHVVVFTVDSFKNMVSRLNLKLLHITGYGVERKILASSLGSALPVKKRIFRLRSWLGQFDLLRQSYRAFKKCFYGLFWSWAARNYYRKFKFDEEGDNRWWFRAVLTKE